LGRKPGLRRLLPQVQAEGVDKVHVIYLTATGPNVIQTVSKPVKTLADLKGVKLRGVGKQGETLKALGAATVPLEMVDVYESIRRGVIEGCMMPVRY